MNRANHKGNGQASLPRRETPGVTIWFTGLSGAGKSTVANAVYAWLKQRGYKVETLDGDVVRTNLTKGLGFSKEDRDENIRRIGFVADLLTRNGVIVITAAISPYREIRDECRRRIGSFVEVFVDCPLDECMKRDVKGLYKKAIAGEIKQFTGISDPYEPPLNPEVVLYTHRESVEQSAATVIERLIKCGYLPQEKVGSQASYTPEETEVIHKRLEQLGYL